MMNMRSLPLIEVTGDARLLGRTKGEAHLPQLTPHLNPPGAVILDFADVEALTTSYFFAALWPFWTREDATGPSTFPLVANAVADIEDEIDLVMKQRRMGAWRGGWDGKLFIPNGFLGRLDDGLDLAITRALTAGVVTAVELSHLDKTSPTAWNNRLVALYKQRMLRRRQSGRKQTYFAPWRDPDDG